MNILPVVPLQGYVIVDIFLFFGLFEAHTDGNTELSDCCRDLAIPVGATIQ